MSTQFRNLRDWLSNFDNSRAKCGARIVEAQAGVARKLGWEFILELA